MSDGLAIRKKPLTKRARALAAWRRVGKKERDDLLHYMLDEATEFVEQPWGEDMPSAKRRAAANRAAVAVLKEVLRG